MNKEHDDNEEKEEIDLDKLKDLDEEDIDQETLVAIKKTLMKLVEDFHKFGVAEYIEIVRSPKRMIYINFLAGLARGFGAVIGATLLGAVFLSILFRVADLNLPLIGEYIARLVKIVKQNL
ncbi:MULTISPECIES: DUF5665 domain-containing protein [unclassified Candidatus Frackibacter]|uniref:DUF5665 domain-containing protein n=1 Tax=unclassified Candidatus Frackibacter TaxID=2648818 RepID=UPI0008910D24|nr:MULTISPECIES: DUF5665 domain-containing protein [unclassified Candidatus Frackibacter]SDC48167.1 hypothetical protein SAMN04515661_11158 [Candidatus Frackibacter sp. WG11]SEM95460.1 hypothetical protein SAMN04488698_12811 [Candidatus Frackibacter sp. WG12]SFL73319.1 hypothetical protein SAMN04488699_11158 [Candidatus Frackibacter sp. WG13]